MATAVMRAAIEQTVKSQKRTPAVYPITTSACCIPRTLSNVHGVWVLHIDRQLFYASHAERIDHLQPTEDMLHNQMGVLIQVFGNCAERMFRKIGAQHKTVKTTAKASSRKKSKKAKKTSSDVDDDADDDDEGEEDEEEEEEEDGEINVRTYGENFHAQSSATAPVQVFIETTMRDTKNRPANVDPFNLKSAITGLRFWILSFDRTLSLDDCLADMLEANAAEALSRAERQAKGFETQQASDASGDWWRRISARSDWMTLCDLNTRYNYCGANAASEFSKTDELRQGHAPYSMTNSFSPAFALHNVSADTVLSQGLFGNPAHYVQRVYDEQSQKWVVRRDPSGAFSFEWPLAEYVNRVQPPQCTSDGFFCRYWPDYQQRRLHPLASIFPSLSSASGLGINVESNEHYLPDYDLDNPALAGASSEVRPVHTRHVDLAQHQRRLDEEARAAQEEALRIEADFVRSLGASGGGGGNMDFLPPPPPPPMQQRKRPRRPFTRKDALYQYIQALGLPNFDERIERFDRRSLAPLARLFKIAQNEWSHFETYFHASPFALLHLEAANLQVLIARKLRETKRSQLDYPELSARVLHLIAQIQSLCGYARSCRAPDSLISEIGRLLHTYRMMTNIYRPEVHRVRPFVFDVRLNAFATRAAIETLDLAKVFGAASNVVHTTMVRMMAHDAYRHTYDMHLNLIQYGDGGAGKSFVFELLEYVFLVEGTVKKLQRETACADSVDGDGNDVITLFHELQMSQFSERRDGGGNSSSSSASAESSLKEKLTSMQVRVAIPVLNKDGTRDQRIIVRSAIGVWLGNTNSDIFEAASGAMRSRFHLKGFPVGPDDVNEIVASKLREMFKTGELSLRQKQIKTEMHLLQVLHYEVEKMFHVGALTTPSLHVGVVLHKMVMTVLKRHGIVAETVRFYQRTIYMARLLCITEALYDHYLRPGAPYLGREITPDSFLSLDARLFVQTPHIVWALGLVEDQILPPHDIHVLRALERLIAAAPAPSTYGLTGSESEHVKSVLKPTWRNAMTEDAATALPANKTTSPGFNFLGSFSRFQDDSENSLPGYHHMVSAAAAAAAPASSSRSFVLRDANGVMLDASYRSFMFKGLDWAGFVEALRTSCAAVCEGRTMPSTSMIEDTLRRLGMRNYTSPRYAFASPSWPNLEPLKRMEIMEHGGLVVVLPEENANAILERPVFVRNAHRVLILATYLHDTLRRVQESSESLMISAVRECLDKRHQLKAIYAYGQEVDENPAAIKLLLLGPDCTLAEVEAVEGYWRTAYRATVARQSALNGGGLTPPPSYRGDATAAAKPLRQVEMMMPNPGFTERAVRMLECSAENNGDRLDEADDPTVEQARVHVFEMEIDQWAALQRCEQLMITGDAVPRSVVLGEQDDAAAAAVDDVPTSLARRLGSMSVADLEFEDAANRRLREERCQDGSHSIHVEGHSYYFGLEVLNDPAHPLGINSQLREDKHYEELSRAADVDVKPDESGEDFDFDEQHFYVPLPRERIDAKAPPHLEAADLEALRSSALASDPNAAEPPPQAAAADSSSIVWVPHWLYLGMPRAHYKLVRYVWTIEGARQRLWQEFSGLYDGVYHWSYPGDLKHDQRNPNNNELWKIVMDSTHPLYARSTRVVRQLSSSSVQQTVLSNKLSRVSRVSEWLESAIKEHDLSEDSVAPASAVAADDDCRRAADDDCRRAGDDDCRRAGDDLCGSSDDGDCRHAGDDDCRRASDEHSAGDVALCASPDRMEYYDDEDLNIIDI